ncbi:glycosyl hydrolase family 61-domain-containing protein [Paraphoma chrysanthemicola]|uniref:lytic cellulose monooxygenase (C4-dehydrogenating) n=1 Tax=Paraphoma chrysanthemicola TaxID=798071 RepID=A0A8K0QVA0_9PLEO|nr:glycosyl hydrolase family 61-domain-containing protein [Paraphoma chrysanthemicola]
MRLTTSTVALLAYASQTLAHYKFERLTVNGVITEPFEYVRAAGRGVSNGPMVDVTHKDIRCNNGSFASASKTKTLTVTAGDTLGFTVNDRIGHRGPLFAYMSKSTVANVSAYEGDGDWFKIYEMGVNTYPNYTVGTTWHSADWKSYNFVIPKDIENGQYLLRAEHIAIHGAGTLGGAQFYISCAQIEVKGATGKKPTPVGKFPGIYNARDPGIFFNPYWPPMLNYTMPGLEVYPKGGSFPTFTAVPTGPAQSQPLPASWGTSKPTAAAAL